MLHNYLTVALRTLRRQAGYTAINVVGLAVGLAVCLLIVLFIRHERSYDRFVPHAEQVYRLVLDAHTPDGTAHVAVSALPFGPAMASTFPEVLDYVRFHSVDALVEHDGRRFQEDDVLYADASVLDVFGLPVAAGDPATALAAPYRAVLTATAARRYFGHTDVVGQTLLVDNTETYTVSAVLDELPPTHLVFDVLLSLSTWEAQNADRTQNWTWHNFYTYLLLPEGADPDALEAKLPAFVERFTDEQEDAGVRFDFPLQPLTDIYLHSGRIAEIGRTGNLAALYVFGAIAVLILLVACINFMNLATARSAHRAREVGMRKVLGARRTQLARQFLSESVLMSLLALGLSLLLARLCLGPVNDLIGTTLTLTPLLSGFNLAVLLVLVVLVGLAAGSYPALVLSGFEPVRVLKGRFRSTHRGQALRRGLVVFQFAVSIALIAGTGVIDAQLDFLQQRDLGFDQEQILVVDFRRDPEVGRRYEAVKEALAAHPAVLDAAASDFTPGGGMGAVSSTIDLGGGQIRDALFPYALIDYDFIDTYGLEVVAGRGFSRDFATDSTEAFLVNETAVEQLGWASPEEALGREVQQWGRTGEIVGVVKDFHFESLHQAIGPLVLHIRPDWFRYVSLRVRVDAIHATMDALEEIWQAQVPHRPFEYAFLDARFNQRYASDRRLGVLFGIFAGLAVFVACLGLFGLAAFTAEQRTREVGIRKVLGASVAGLVVLLAKEFTRPVVVALVVAAPVVYLAMGRWLSTFAYHVEMSWGIFLWAGLAALGVALLAVGFHTTRTALANPVDSLRHE